MSDEACRACGKRLDFYSGMADGCPCNSPRGVNHGLVPRHVCTCAECDPAQTGSCRKLDVPALLDSLTRLRAVAEAAKAHEAAVDSMSSEATALRYALHAALSALTDEDWGAE